MSIGAIPIHSDPVLAARAASDPRLAALLTEVQALAASHPGSELLTAPATTAGRLLVRIPALPMTGDWSPATVPALLDCTAWPQQRPQLLVKATVRRNGSAPQNFTLQYLEEESYYSYSFSAPYTSEHPALAPVVRGWLKRFDGRE